MIGNATHHTHADDVTEPKVMRVVGYPIWQWTTVLRFDATVKQRLYSDLGTAIQ